MIGFIYNILDWSYRRLVTIFTILGIIGIIILAILGFLLSEIIIPIFVIIWLVWVSALWWSKRKTEDTINWSLRTAWQQIKDWRFARRLRKEKERKAKEEENYGFSLP